MSVFVKWKKKHSLVIDPDTMVQMLTAEKKSAVILVNDRKNSFPLFFQKQQNFFSVVFQKKTVVHTCTILFLSYQL